MTFAGVPILDWVLLIVLIGFAIEAYVTTRPSDDKKTPSKLPNDPKNPSTETARNSDADYMK